MKSTRWGLSVTTPPPGWNSGRTNSVAPASVRFRGSPSPMVRSTSAGPTGGSTVSMKRRGRRSGRATRSTPLPGMGSRHHPSSTEERSTSSRLRTACCTPSTLMVPKPGPLRRVTVCCTSPLPQATMEKSTAQETGARSSASILQRRAPSGPSIRGGR